jgi:hypothetical protein
VEAALDCAATVSLANGGRDGHRGSDYTPITGALSFPAGSPSGSRKSVAVPLVTANVIESDETLRERRRSHTHPKANRFIAVANQMSTRLARGECQH